jgi:hypothetical protein
MYKNLILRFPFWEGSGGIGKKCSIHFYSLLLQGLGAEISQRTAGDIADRVSRRSALVIACSPVIQAIPILIYGRIVTDHIDADTVAILNIPGRDIRVIVIVQLRSHPLAVRKFVIADKDGRFFPPINILYEMIIVGDARGVFVNDSDIFVVAERRGADIYAIEVHPLWHRGRGREGFASDVDRQQVGVTRLPCKATGAVYACLRLRQRGDHPIILHRHGGATDPGELVVLAEIFCPGEGYPAFSGLIGDLACDDIPGLAAVKVDADDLLAAGEAYQYKYQE